MEYFFKEGCWIRELLNTETDPTVSVARVRVEAEISTEWHSLTGITERYLIMEGQGKAEVGTEVPVHVIAGDRITIPPGVRQRITNTGKVDLIFLAVCTPRFTEDQYREEC